MVDTVHTGQKQNYLADLEKARTLPGPDWARQVRQSGVDRFQELDFPNRRQEEWRFTNIAPIINTPFRSLVEPSSSPVPAGSLARFLFGESGWIEWVFIDGFFSPALSRTGELPEGVRAGSLADMIRSDGESVAEHLDRYAAPGNIFTALNSAFLRDGAVVWIPKNCPAELRIHLVFVTISRGDNTASYPRNLIVAEPFSQAKIVESYVSLAEDSSYLNNVVTEIVVGEGAKIEAVKIVEEGPRGYHLATVRVRQERSSTFVSHVITLGARIARNELSVLLDGEGADCSLNGLYLAGEEQLVDNATSIEHAQPRCTSWIGYRGVLDGHSHGVFTGRIKVRRHAQKTDSKQLNNNLLLSDTATVNTKPLLEILADDVKCTHGATVGQPPGDVVFYLQTRGISEAQARTMLTRGFCSEIVNLIPVEPLRDRLNRIVQHRFGAE